MIHSIKIKMRRFMIHSIKIKMRRFIPVECVKPMHIYASQAQLVKPCQAVTALNPNITAHH